MHYDHDFEPGAYGVCRRCGDEKHGPAGSPTIAAGADRAKSGLLLAHLPAIKLCTVCGRGTVRRHPAAVLECDCCGALGDPCLGLMEPIARVG